jgi:ATP adenylyltransferase
VETLWAGWRSEYIRGEETGSECLFCRLPREADGDALILERGEHAYTMLNRFPYNTGHLMVSQYRHAAGMGDLSDAERDELWHLLDRGRIACEAAMSPDGFNLGANIGRVAGAGVPGHFHLHLVPRWLGDTNFMMAVGGTRVLPEDLSVTWQSLREAL